MAEQSNGSSSAVPIVAIIAIGALVLFLAWYFMVRDSQTTTPAPTTTETQPPPTQTRDSDIDIKVDLPDSVIIK